MEFKIGDRVENQQRGKGTVCAIDGRLYSIGVNFDIGAPEMHSCSRKCPEGHGWFLGTSELSLIGSEKVERFEVGKWYQCDNGRGPGRHIGCHSCGWPGFYYPNWNNGHNGNGQPGIPKEVGNHCWYELGDFREVPAERVNGRHGVIENDDHSSSPYNIRVDNGGRYWFTEEEVVPEAPDKMGGEGPTTRDFQADRLAEDRTGTVRAFRGSRQGRARQALRQGGQVMGIEERLAAVEAKLGIESPFDGPIIVWDSDRMSGAIYPAREYDGDSDTTAGWDHFSFLTPEIIAAIKALPEADK